MEEVMNKPTDTQHTDKDIIADYKLYQDKRKIAKRYNISVKDVNVILKRNEG